MSLLYYTTWYPGDKGYKEHLDRFYIHEEQKYLTNEWNDRYLQNLKSNQIQTNERIDDLIISNGNLANEITRGFTQLNDTLNSGINSLNASIESLHSSIVYYSGIIIQKLDYQNEILENINESISAPFETQVHELYKNAIRFIKYDNYNAAIELLKDSINLKLGKYYFPSHYQLGLLFLNGKTENQNVINLSESVHYLEIAHGLAKDIIKEDKGIISYLIKCKYNLAYAYFYQFNLDSPTNSQILIDKSINLINEVIKLDPMNSQAIYSHIKFSCVKFSLENSMIIENKIEDVLINFTKLIELDRNYIRSIVKKDVFMYDRNLEIIRPQLHSLVGELTNIKKDLANKLIDKCKKLFLLLEDSSINNSLKYKVEYENYLSRFNAAQKHYNEGNYSP